MIVFSIAVPVDLPAPVIDWLRRTIHAATMYLTALGHKAIPSEIDYEEDDNAVQGS